MIQLNNVVKTYTSHNISNTVLKGISLKINKGEFVAIIGKSGSGKSTLLNMITAIDEVTSGDIQIANTSLLNIKKKNLAKWRGENIGIIFQFFQLLPTLSLLENVMIPMDFCNMYSRSERKERALSLLKQVGMEEHANKLPSMISGGQQQRVAIARALANDPPIIIADEPTGSLDSKTADAIFDLFKGLVDQGKTIVMVTHDNDLAQKVDRAIIVADGEIVDEHVISAFPHLNLDDLTSIQTNLVRKHYSKGTNIITAGEDGDSFYIILSGEVEILVKHPQGQDIVLNHLHKGQYFGEIALFKDGKRTATVRALNDVQVVEINKKAFTDIVSHSSMTKNDMNIVIQQRLSELIKRKENQYVSSLEESNI